MGLTRARSRSSSGRSMCRHPRRNLLVTRAGTKRMTRPQAPRPRSPPQTRPGRKPLARPAAPRNGSPRLWEPLAAIIGTAPLTPLGGKDVHWLSLPGLAIVGGIVLLGVTLFMVTAVLVPGMTFFTNLTGRKRNRLLDWWLPDHLFV